jgi:acyl-CoA hydrolase
MDKKKCIPKNINSTRLVKSEDLNHHGTLFAGRTAEWFVESGFISAATLVNPKWVVCLKVHGMYFTKPVKLGEMIRFSSKIVYAGRTSLISHINVTREGDDVSLVNGFITFIYVNDQTIPTEHCIEITPITDEDIALYEEAKALKK